MWSGSFRPSRQAPKPAMQSIILLTYLVWPSSHYGAEAILLWWRLSSPSSALLQGSQARRLSPDGGARSHFYTFCAANSLQLSWIVGYSFWSPFLPQTPSQKSNPNITTFMALASSFWHQWSALHSIVHYKEWKVDAFPRCWTRRISEAGVKYKGYKRLVMISSSGHINVFLQDMKVDSCIQISRHWLLLTVSNSDSDAKHAKSNVEFRHIRL